MATLPKTPAASPVDPESFEFSEAPTQKRSVPDELGEAAPPVRVTTKLRKVEVEALLSRERAPKPPAARSGVQPAMSEDDVARYELREHRETMPAPAQANADADDERDADGTEGR